MGKQLDLTGQRFGRLLAVRPTVHRLHGSVVWLCRCDCGTEAAVPSNSLRSGNTRSCGCQRAEHNHERALLALRRREGEPGPGACHPRALCNQVRGA